MEKRKKPRRTAKFRTMLMEQKTKVVFGVILVLFAILNIQLILINVTKGDQYTKRVLAQKEGYVNTIIPYKRGSILASNGEKLAYSEKVYYLILDCSVINQADDLMAKKNGNTKGLVKNPTVDLLLECFGDKEGVTREAIENYLNAENPQAYIRLAKEISYQEKQNFENRAKEVEAAAGTVNQKGEVVSKDVIQGVWFEETYIRKYPYNSLACHTIGFTVSGNDGFWGLEEYYNDYLNGKEGREYGYLNSDSNVEDYKTAAQDGCNLVTTLDMGIQQIIEEEVLAFNEAHRNEVRTGITGLGSKHTAVIVMEPDTGRILGMTGYPNFDLNNPRDLTFTGMYSQQQADALEEQDKTDALNSIWRNFCISDTYEPGSTYKPFTVSAGLESGKLKDNETYYCDGYEIIDGALVRCSHTAGHGSLTTGLAVAQSCNDALMQMSYKIGVNTFTRYQSVFGFGKKTGIDLPGEVNAANLLYTADNMTDLDLAVNAFGQNFNATMIQMAAGMCSVINDGKYYRPHLVDRIENADGETVATFKPTLIKQTISPETSALLREYMHQVVESGTALSAAVPGYIVGGKTGTAEKFPRKKINYLVSFLGFAPVDDPELFVYVVIDEPNVENQANSKLAIDLCQAIMSRVFPYYGVTREDGTSTRDVTVVDAKDISWVYESQKDLENTEIWTPGTGFSDNAEIHFDGLEAGEDEDYPEDQGEIEPDDYYETENTEEDSGGGEDTYWDDTSGEDTSGEDTGGGGSDEESGGEDSYDQSGEWDEGDSDQDSSGEWNEEDSGGDGGGEY